SLSGPEHLGILALQVKRAIAETLLSGASKGLQQLQEAIDHDLSNHSQELPTSVELMVDLERHTRGLENVAGLLPGRDPALRDQVIVIGAHYDHLGLGERDSMAPGDIGKIHYGADDNASGSAGLLELACDMAHNSHLKRSVLFLAFAGEELGL